MKSTPRLAMKIVGMSLFACILSFFVYMSFFTMIKSFTTQVIGYEVHEVLEDGTSKDHGFVEPDDVPKERPKNMKYVAVFSEIPKSANIIMGVLQTLFGLGIFFCTTGSVLANVAAKDRNNCEFNGIVHNKNKGFTIGLFVAIPSVLLYICAFVLRFLTPSSFSHIYYWVYRWIIMCPVKPIVDVFTSNAATLEAAPVWSIAVQGIFVVFIVLYCYAMYRLCYNADSVLAKLLYKSTNDDKNIRRLGRR